MTNDAGYMNITQTAAALGVNRRRVWQMVKSGELASVQNPLDRRETLVPRAEIERLAQFAKKKP